HRLIYTFNYEEPDPDDQETLVTLTFESTGGGTRVTVDQGPFKTAARLALHRDGWTETLERFERSVVAGGGWLSGTARRRAGRRVRRAVGKPRPPPHATVPAA